MSEKPETTGVGAPVESGSSIDSWLIVAFVVCIFLGLGVLAWHYQPSSTPEHLCANAEAHCGDKVDGNPQ